MLSPLSLPLSSLSSETCPAYSNRKRQSDGNLDWRPSQHPAYYWGIFLLSTPAFTNIANSLK